MGPVQRGWSPHASVEELSGDEVLRRAMVGTTRVGLLRYGLMETLGNASLDRAELCADQGLEREARYSDFKLGLWRTRLQVAHWRCVRRPAERSWSVTGKA